MHQPILQNKKLEQSQEPKLYTVVIHNDDFTPVDFVVELLAIVFKLSDAEAEIITWNIHSADKANVGSFTREIAESKADQCNTIARKCEHPLLSEIAEL